MPNRVDQTVAIVTPTRGRQDRLPYVYRAIKAQDHPISEWLVYDDGPDPSPFMRQLHDPSVVYRFTSRNVSLGSKRDYLVRTSSADIIVQFDDDDYYAPSYVRSMASHLRSADLVTFGSWHVVDTSRRRLFSFDPLSLTSPKAYEPSQSSPQEAWLHRSVWGYGFSYVFRRELCRSASFRRGMTFGEDYDFVCRATSLGGRALLVPGTCGLAFHTVHGSSTSRSFVTRRLPLGRLRDIYGVGGVAFTDELAKRRV